MLSALLLNYSSGIPPRANRTLTGAREQQTEPAYHAAMRYIVLGRPPSLPANFLSCFPSHQRPSFSDIQELAGKARLHTTDDGIDRSSVNQLRNPRPIRSTRWDARLVC